jgi:hypothetical protein
MPLFAVAPKRLELEDRATCDEQVRPRESTTTVNTDARTDIPFFSCELGMSRVLPGLKDRGP